MKAGEMITAGDQKSAGAGAGISAHATTELPRRSLQSRDKPTQRIALQPVGKLFSPTGLLVWIAGLLGAAACVAPWIAHGWSLFALMVTIVAVFASYDALELWIAREECAPVLLAQEKGLRGREGQALPFPLALLSSGRCR